MLFDTSSYFEVKFDVEFLNLHTFLHTCACTYLYGSDLYIYIALRVPTTQNSLLSTIIATDRPK